MIIVPGDMQAHPLLVRRVAAGLGEVEDEAELWSAFLEAGALSKYTARDQVRVGQAAPILNLRALGAAPARFDPFWPDHVVLATWLARRVAADPPDAAAERLATVALLGAVADRSRYRMNLPTVPSSIDTLLSSFMDSDSLAELTPGSAAPQTGRRIELTDDHLDALARLASAEARILALRGTPPRVAYGSVVDAVINRLAADWTFYGKTIDEVIRPSQFSPLISHATSTWRGLPKAPAEVFGAVLAYLRDREAGGAPVVGPRTHFLNPHHKSTQDDLNSWASKMPNPMIIGRAPHAHVFWNADPDRLPKPHHLVLVTPNAQ